MQKSHQILDFLRSMLFFIVAHAAYWFVTTYRPMEISASGEALYLSWSCVILTFGFTLFGLAFSCKYKYTTISIFVSNYIQLITLAMAKYCRSS